MTKRIISWIVCLSFMAMPSMAQSLVVSGQIAGHDYVDLGLPSGTLWATYNVGATKPEQYGYYFAWGETEPKDVYNDWSTYKYATTIGEDLDSITKYNMSGRYGIIDSLSTLLPEDDAAAANWGSEWRMPTNEEQGELYENSYMVWTDGYNGTDVSGVIFYKAKEDSDKGQYMAPWRGEPSADYSESSDAHVFFPAAGYRLGSDVLAKGNCGYYWSSSLYEKREDFAHDLGFSGKDVGWNYSVRGYGCPVRAVANKTTDIEEYVVSFYTQDSVLIESQKVEKEKSATAVDAPVVDGYEFIGWSDSSFTNVTKDLDIYAQYKAITKDTLPVSGQIAGHDYIDLGLPSGTLWATYNVGATTPTEYGDYFAWGETEPKEVYADSTYKWFNADSKIYTKYNSEDGLKTLLPEDDAATANWGSEWRMPTNEEQRELYENSYMVWTDGYNGTDVIGVIFYKAKEDSDKGQYMAPWEEPSSDYSVSDDAHVFFPAAGVRYGSNVNGKGEYGDYWSSSLYEKVERYARRLNFSEKGVGWSDNNNDRGKGYSVRAVANKTTDIEEYVVSFYTQDSVLIESQKVEKGKSATTVDAPVVDGYEFIGWSDSSFTNVMKDLDIYAQYKAITKDTLPVSGQIAGHDYIDLGLPSGTLWATYNVGATTPEEYGDYFAWGETEPKEVYADSTYKWFNADSKIYTKYNSEDGLMTLLPEDDAATANWGSEWRMPTNEERRELVEECQSQMTEVNGVYGAKFTGKNGNSVFFPAAGYRNGSDVSDKGDYGVYWSSSLGEKVERYARYLGFGVKNVYWGDDDRSDGFSVRAVANGTSTSASTISNHALLVCADNGSIHVANAQPNTKIQVFDMNGKTVASGATDAEGSAEIRLSVLKGVYVVSDGNQSTKVVVK